jgi:DNA polymerase V
MLTELVGEGDHTVDMFDTRDVKRQSKLMAAMDEINSQMGTRTLFYAGTGVARAWTVVASSKSPAYSTDWNSLITVQAK